MKKVHVVFKTHLDLGFTDLAANVLDNYNKNYIPRAVDLAFELNEGGDDPKFIWTTGSYLIWQYLKTQSTEMKQRLCEAIKKGYITWHALPVTYHSEAAGNLVLNESLKITKELDMMFNRQTISSKMTDVPGHTKAIVPLLKDNGIEFLHIGMNAVSALPDVPNNFIWEHQGKQIIVAYSLDYGSIVQIDGCDDILVFAHTHDNSGPQSKEKILNQLEELKLKYPDYTVCASTMDNYVAKLLQADIKLPVVTEEIGDTWIHGIASDPKKMRDYNRITALVAKWIDNKQMTTNDSFYLEFISNLMLVPEHTWGMDIKRYFSDYKNYTKQDFISARKKDVITDQALTYRYSDVAEATRPEMKYTSHTWEERAYSLYESSWKEQRKYLANAIDCLPSQMQKEAKDNLKVTDYHQAGDVITPYQNIKIGEYQVQINEHGAMCLLVKNNINYASSANQLFKLQYTVIGLDSYELLRKKYLRDLDKHFWAVDFLKPGLELQSEIINTTTYDAFVSKLSVVGKKIIVDLYINSQASIEYGAPRKIQLVYEFTDVVTISVALKDKEASRYPEIISLAINPKVNNYSRYQIEKLGSLLNPLDVVGSGSKTMHAIDNTIVYAAADKEFKIKAIDSRVISIGQIDNLDFQTTRAQIENGFYFHLLNTTWGTNFTMWYEEDIDASFELQL